MTRKDRERRTSFGEIIPHTYKDKAQEAGFARRAEAVGKNGNEGEDWPQKNTENTKRWGKKPTVSLFQPFVIFVFFRG